MKRIAVLVNGPGELWGWGRPFLRELEKAGHAVDLFLLPCQFASGAEARIALLLDASRIVHPVGFWKNLARREKPFPDIVLQLGGDLFYGRALAARNGVPLFSYSYGLKKGLRACKAVYTACEAMAGPMKSSGRIPVEVVGDLVADGLAMDQGEAPWKGPGLRIVIFPGSRPAIRRKALPYMAEFLGFAKTLLPGAQWAVLLYPFCEPEEAHLWEKAGFVASLAGTGAVLAEADVALTQPGTNTLELLHAGVPSIVAVPDDFVGQVPSPTLLAPLFGMPGFGPALKRRALRRYIGKMGFLSWPNRLSGREVFPEITGKVSPGELARRFASYAGDGKWIEETRKALGKIDRGPSNAASRLRERIMENLQ
jgi:lipid-A-disaccharide synthase